MEIVRDRTNNNYSYKNKILGNCFTITCDNQSFFYEFDIHKNQALIITNDIKYIENAIDEFRKYNFNITTFYTKDKCFYKSFDEVFTFKLPINIIQPSQFFINEDKLLNIENNLDFDDITLPVAIINDEYVLLDGHTRLYYLYLNNIKMVNVYIDSYDSYIKDFIYIAKENNIFNIEKLTKLNNEDYEKYWIGFCNSYFENK